MPGNSANIPWQKSCTAAAPAIYGRFRRLLSIQKCSFGYDAHELDCYEAFSAALIKKASRALTRKSAEAIYRHFSRLDIAWCIQHKLGIAMMDMSADVKLFGLLSYSWGAGAEDGVEKATPHLCILFRSKTRFHSYVTMNNLS